MEILKIRPIPTPNLFRGLKSSLFLEAGKIGGEA
jgi:hypothetical protein